VKHHHLPARSPEEHLKFFSAGGKKNDDIFVIRWQTFGLLIDEEGYVLDERGIVKEFANEEEARAHNSDETRLVMASRRDVRRLQEMCRQGRYHTNVTPRYRDAEKENDALVAAILAQNCAEVAKAILALPESYIFKLVRVNMFRQFRTAMEKDAINLLAAMYDKRLISSRHWKSENFLAYVVGEYTSKIKADCDRAPLITTVPSRSKT
jgi:hypothetical protein